MTGNLYRDLAWLPPAPADFGPRCRDLNTATPDLAAAIRALTTHALDDSQLIKLARAIERCRAEAPIAGLTPFKLGIVGNGTLDALAPPLVASAARHGISLECVKGHYDQMLQDALSPDSAINRARPDAVLVALDYRGLPLEYTPGSEAGERQAVDAAASYLATIRAGIRQHGGAPCLVQTLAAPPEALFGSLDRALPGTPRRVIDQLNGEIAASLAGSQDVLLDIAALAETVGLGEWHSPVQWNMAKLGFSQDYLPLYAEHVARTLGALRGKSRRCLILDLDNTVWGGVIGDDGLAGIKIAQGDATGEAHLSVQSFALALRSRGVVLAVCSKNTDAVARSPFRDSPEMLLREDHVAVFQANWDDKATNIRAIANELSLGLESMVFLDDNPMERDIVRRMIPQVAVPELPEDPALYARTLAAAGYFEATTFSAEDGARAEMYQQNARRATLQAQAGDLGAYLASLDMEISFAPFDAAGRARISQLINKSNQFNLTTRRYSEAEVAAVEAAPDCFTLQVRLVDKFGDNGMISCIVARPRASDEWEIDTWLMSCRVLGRGVERMVLREIMRHAREHGVRRLIGVYLPTSRNQLVEDHYRKLGFTAVGSAADNGSEWELDTDAEIEAAPMRVARRGFAMADA